MIQFVNAKINLGLSITGRRPDGYHLLETCFLPIGLHNGTPGNPEPFCDVLEITDGDISATDPVPGGLSACSYREGPASFFFSGNRTDCPPGKNLVAKAARLFFSELGSRTADDVCDIAPVSVSLRKMIPDGAGLGGGSADASFTLTMLNRHYGNPFSTEELERMAVKLGADCPVFIRNRPTFAEGIGEIFSPVDSTAVESLTSDGRWLAIVKPDLHISTAEAFAGLTPGHPEMQLREALRLPAGEWRGRVVNDFETSLFPLYPELPRLKEALYHHGAIYASLTGSGAALYGIYPDALSARKAIAAIGAPYSTAVKL